MVAYDMPCGTIIKPTEIPASRSHYNAGNEEQPGHFDVTA